MYHSIALAPKNLFFIFCTHIYAVAPALSSASPFTHLHLLLSHAHTHTRYLLWLPGTLNPLATRITTPLFFLYICVLFCFTEPSYISSHHQGKAAKEGQKNIYPGCVSVHYDIHACIHNMLSTITSHFLSRYLTFLVSPGSWLQPDYLLLVFFFGWKQALPKKKFWSHLFSPFITLKKYMCSTKSKPSASLILRWVW